MTAVGSLHTCAGHVEGFETAVNAMRDLFHSHHYEAAHLQCLNSVNHQAALQNIFIQPYP